MALFVKSKVAKPRVRIICLWRNGIFSMMFGNKISDFFSTVSFITENITIRNVNTG